MARTDFIRASDQIRQIEELKDNENRQIIGNIAVQVDNGAGLYAIDNQTKSAESVINGQQDQLNDVLDSAAAANARGEMTQQDYAIIERRAWAVSGDLDNQRGALQNLNRRAYSENGAQGRNDRSAVQPGQKNVETDLRTSSGNEVTNDQQAKVSGANNQSPDRVSFEEGEDDPIVPPEQQALDGEAVSSVQGSEQPLTSNQTQAGQSNNNDDQTDVETEQVGVTSTVDTRPEIADEFKKPIQARPNKLSNYASSTYSISIYLMNATEYRQLIQGAGSYRIPTQQLILQSGGAKTGERNPNFDVDFYLNNLSIDTIFGTQGVGAPHTIAQINFNVIEPNGITFLQRLKKAVKEHTGQTGNETSELMQNFLMVISFYGYDQNGNLVASSTNSRSAIDQESNSLTQKFIPFTIRNITYKIATGGTTYDVSAIGINTNIGFSQSRGVVPFNLQLVAPDIQTLLNGSLSLANGQVVDEEADAFADLEDNATPQNSGLSGATVAQGLTAALNRHQDLLVSKGAVEIADTYKIVIEDVRGLIDARLAKPGKRNKRDAATYKLDNIDKYTANKLVYDKDTRTYNVAAGTQISQLIDLVLRASSYVTSQQSIQYDEKTGKPLSSTPEVETVQWYRIKCSVLPKEYDKIRRDYAYEITYTINRYQINTPRTPGFPSSQYRGVHKEYKYWFTGENTEIIDFEIDVNANYVTVIDDSGVTDTSDQGQFSSRQVYQSAPNSSLQGGTNNSSRPAAQLTDRLYSLADVAKTELTILGDPDWLQQADFYLNQATINLSPFTDDGGVNTESGEILFSVEFNPVSDVNLTTGLAESLTPLNTNNNEFVRDNREKITWGATRCNSIFANGAFTQTVLGTYRTFASSRNVPNSPLSNTTADPFELDTDLAQTIPAQRNQVPIGSNTAKADPVTQSRRLQSNGSTTNFNVKQEGPSRTVNVNGRATQVYGSQQNLAKFYGSNSADDDAGTDIPYNG